MEPERKIEKLLRAFAKRRRDQAGNPLEMHPAVRRRLQNEVARQFSKTLPAGFVPRIIGLLRPRFIYGLAVVAIAAVAVALLLPPYKAKSKTQLASRRAEITRESQLAQSVATPPPAAPVPLAAPEAKSAAVDRLNHDLNSAVRGAGKLKSEVASSEQQKLPGPPAGTVLEAHSASSVVPNAAPAVAKASPALTAGAAGDAGTSNLFGAASEPMERRLALELPKTSASDVVLFQRGGAGSGGESRNRTLVSAGRQDFVQINDARRTLSSPSNAAPVLASFAVEQNGGELRVVDGDGSVYSGFVQLVGAPDLQKISATRSVTPAAATPVKDMRDKEVSSTAGENYFFRVTGTNRSLQQRLVFTGNLFSATNGLQLNFNTNPVVIGGGPTQTLSQQFQQVPLQNMRITGTAVIDGSKRIEILAAPTPPGAQK
jgi:hypothetical protein